ncbi:MAG: hypothetical protein K0B06_05165 [Brevefilum sp.]|nr:hypothetical protein [Brevefilum sp.]
MTTQTYSPHDFYALQGQISDPGEFAHQFDTLPADLPGIIAAIQGVMLHLPWDNFKLIAKSFGEMNAEEKGLMDRMATISSGEDQDFVLLRAAFITHQGRLLPDYFL